MDMMAYVLTLSRHLRYRMNYDTSTCLRIHSIFGGYYYFQYICPYFISVDVDTLVITSYPPISNIMVTHVLLPMTISTYNFFFTIFFPFAFVLELNSSTFPILSLVDGSPIYNVYMCFHPMPCNFTNRYSCKDFVNKSASMCSMLQYAINVLLLPTRSFTKKFHILMCLEFLVHYFFPFFSIFIALWLSWNKIFCLMSYPWSSIN